MPPIDTRGDHDRLLTLAEAIAAALDAVRPVRETETVPLLEAYGRMLAADLPARLDVPPHDNSAMDGFALYRADLQADGPTRLPVIGQALAGHPYAGVVPRGVAVRITTGAVLPTGPDAVIMQEQCAIAPDESEIVIEPQAAARLEPGANIRRRGEDVQAGTVLLAGGSRLRPQEVSLAAGQGIAALTVRHRPRVAVASTGDELYEPDAELLPGAIHESNRYLLIGLLRRLGCAVSDLGILRDRRDTMLPALRDAAAAHDVLLTSGGVSVGTADLVKDVLAELGSIEFWRLAVKPGKPVMFGKLVDTVFTGLPGNPFAVFVGYNLFVKQQVMRLSGKAERAPEWQIAPARFAWTRKPGRAEIFPVRRVVSETTGEAELDRLGKSVSATLYPLTSADGLGMVAANCEEIRPGDAIRWQPFC